MMTVMRMGVVLTLMTLWLMASSVGVMAVDFTGDLRVTVLNGHFPGNYDPWPFKPPEIYIKVRVINNAGSVVGSGQTDWVDSDRSPSWNRNFNFGRVSATRITFEAKDYDPTSGDDYVTTFSYGIYALKSQGNYQLTSSSYTLNVAVTFTPDPAVHNCFRTYQASPMCTFTCNGGELNLGYNCFSEFYNGYRSDTECNGLSVCSGYPTAQACPSAAYQYFSCMCSSLYLYGTTCISQSSCSQLQPQHYAAQRSNFQNECLPVSSCGVRQFEFRPPTSSTDRVCNDCPLSCSACTSETQCTGCQLGFYLFGTSCVSTCPVGFFPSGGRCEPCMDSCISCTDGVTCTSCKVGFLTSSNSCDSTCGLHEFADTATTCERCDPSCETCVGAMTACTSCPATTYLQDSTCVLNCPEGTTASDADNRCHECPDNCAVCRDEGAVCVTCRSPHVLFEGQCVDECPEGEVSYTSPQDGGLRCNRCGRGFYQNGNTCTPCGPGTYQDELGSTECKPCADGQYTMEGANAVFPAVSDLACFPCDAGTYQPGTAMACERCGSGTISELGATECFTCEADTVPLNGVACRPCTPGTFSQPGLESCLPCDAMCAECSMAATNCTRFTTTTTTTTRSTTTTIPTSSFASSTSTYTTTTTASATPNNGPTPPSPTGDATTTDPSLATTTTQDSGDASTAASSNSKSSSSQVTAIAAGASGAVVVLVIVVWVVFFAGCRRRDPTKGKVVIVGGDANGGRSPQPQPSIVSNPMYVASSNISGDEFCDDGDATGLMSHGTLQTADNDYAVPQTLPLSHTTPSSHLTGSNNGYYSVPHSHDIGDDPYKVKTSSISWAENPLSGMHHSMNSAEYSHLQDNNLSHRTSSLGSDGYNVLQRNMGDHVYSSVDA